MDENQSGIVRSVLEARPKTVGNNVFRYWQRATPEDDYTTLWILLFLRECLLFVLYVTQFSRIGKIKDEEFQLTRDDNFTNKLYFGDNLHILRQNVADESVDLTYLDPPFNSNATYNVLFREKSGEQSAAPMRSEAAAAGFYEPSHFLDHRFPRVQILTIEELLSGAQAQYPRFAPDATFRRAPRRQRQQREQKRMI